jgi:hypothetical protein
MNNKEMFTKHEIIDKANEVKLKEKEYNNVINQKPNVKSDNIEDIVDWFKQILLVLKK